MKKTNNIYFVLISVLLMAGCGKVEPTIEPTAEPSIDDFWQYGNLSLDLSLFDYSFT